MEALGDAKQLQHEQFRKAQGIDYMTKPPIGLPTSMKGQEADTLPGGVTYFDSGHRGHGPAPALRREAGPEPPAADIQDVRGGSTRPSTPTCS
jgi:hypothetical protein